MIVSPDFVRNGAIRCLAYSAVLLSVGGYLAHQAWSSWRDGVITSVSRGGRVTNFFAGEPGWYWTFSLTMFLALLALLMGFRYALVFALPRRIRDEELAKLVDFYRQRPGVSPRLLAAVLICLAVATLCSFMR